MILNNHGFSLSRTVAHDGKDVHLLSIPKFSETSSVVLLNLKTLAAEEIIFDAEF